MTRKVGLVTLMLIALCLGAVCSVAVAGTASPLTAQEYDELNALDKAFVAFSTKPTLAKVATALDLCENLQVVSPLTRAEKTNCRDEFTTLEREGELAQARTRCEKLKGDDAQLTCLVTPFRNYYHAVVVQDRSADAIGRIAQSRGFGGFCLDALGGSPVALKAAKMVVADLHAELKAMERRDERAATKAAARAFTAAYHEAVASLAGEATLASCPQVTSTGTTTSTTGTTTGTTTTTTTTTTTATTTTTTG